MYIGNVILGISEIVVTDMYVDICWRLYAEKKYYLYL